METQDKTTSLIKEIAAATKKRAKALNQQENEAMVIDLVNPDPLESSVKPWLKLNVLVGFFGGLLLAMGGVLLKDYLKEN